MATAWETMKQQPMATPWENKQNCGVRHRLLKSVALSVREKICSFPNLRARTAFVFAILPWVARCRKLSRINRALTRNRLHSDIHFRLFQGFYNVFFGKEFIIFTKKSHGHSGTQNSFYSGISKILKR